MISYLISIVVSDCLATREACETLTSDAPEFAGELSRHGGCGRETIATRRLIAYSVVASMLQFGIAFFSMCVPLLLHTRLPFGSSGQSYH